VPEIVKLPADRTFDSPAEERLYRKQRLAASFTSRPATRSDSTTSG
jgi:hypothetical protein